MQTTATAKKQLRTAMFAQRAALDAVEKRQYDEWVCAELYKVIIARRCSVVHTYLPIAKEIDIVPLIIRLMALGIKIICPKTLRNRALEHRVLHSLQALEVGIMKTAHPAEPDIYEGKLDLIIVPGLAFDDRCYRLGYGGGYYDTFLHTQPHAYKVGIFYPFQKVSDLPVEAHDIKLDSIICKPFG